MIIKGDYIRDKRDGKLHVVMVVTHDRYYTKRMSDNYYTAVPRCMTVKVTELSLLPGLPEKTERAA